MVYKNQNIPLLVKSVQTKTSGFCSILFERPRGFIFDAGDWIDIAFQKADLDGGKTYSIASSPTEQDISITFRLGITPFKKALASLKAKDQLKITQYGNDYGFRLKDSRTSVLLAGGVGIAPFRSMLKEMYDLQVKNTVQLIYLNQSSAFLFDDELNKWKQSLPNLSIDYVVTKELKRKDRKKLIKSLISDVNQQFYIAGPEGMVSSTQKILDSIGVSKQNVKVDNFGLY